MNKKLMGIIFCITLMGGYSFAMDAIKCYEACISRVAILKGVEPEETLTLFLINYSDSDGSQYKKYCGRLSKHGKEEENPSITVTFSKSDFELIREKEKPFSLLADKKTYNISCIQDFGIESENQTRVLKMKAELFASPKEISDHQCYSMPGILALHQGTYYYAPQNHHNYVALDIDQRGLSELKKLIKNQDLDLFVKLDGRESDHDYGALLIQCSHIVNARSIPDLSEVEKAELLDIFGQLRVAIKENFHSIAKGVFLIVLIGGVIKILTSK